MFNCTDADAGADAGADEDAGADADRDVGTDAGVDVSVATCGGGDVLDGSSVAAEPGATSGEDAEVSGLLVACAKSALQVGCGG